MLKNRQITVSDVFKTQGSPTFTYVSVSEGSYERDLRNAIQNKGTLCLVTGPSKTGKTTLVVNVCSFLHLEPLVVRCNQDLTPPEFWKKALERINFDRATAHNDNATTGAEIGAGLEGKLGWSWLAAFTGKVSTKLTKERGEEYYRERVLADPGPEHLVPVLRRLSYFLVVEDFHYLRPSTQANIFQQWKLFVDEEISVAVLGTTHHACDLAFANKDLIGRIRHLQMTTWDQHDLALIALQGFDTLHVEIPDPAISSIANESAGLPLITQAICLQLANVNRIRRPENRTRKLNPSTADLFKLYNDIAISSFGQFEPMYERIARGLRRQKKPKSSTYEYLLSVFTLDPIVYKLRLEQVLERLESLPTPGAAKPKESSVKQSLARLNSLQEKMGTSLLEWHARDATLYIVEPSFLFYLRWRKSRTTAPSIYDFFRDLCPEIRVVERYGRLKVELLSEE